MEGDDGDNEPAQVPQPDQERQKRQSELNYNPKSAVQFVNSARPVTRRKKPYSGRELWRPHRRRPRGTRSTSRHFV